MKILFWEFARLELIDAVVHYELEYKGLGKRFKDKVKKTALRIAKYPFA